MPASTREGLPDAVEGDLDWCHEAVQDVSRTFALTVDILEEPMSSYICLGYLLCRVPDTIEDASDLPPDVQADLLRAYDAALAEDAPEDAAAAFGAAVAEWLPPEAERSPDWAVVADAERVLRTFHRLPPDVRAAIRGPTRELVSGMAMFVERYADTRGLRIRSTGELTEYCHYVAGTIGTLVTNLVARDAPAGVERDLRASNEAFGLLLQLVNIAKDVHQDFHRENNVYLPADRLAARGVDQDAVCAPGNEPAVAGVVREVAGYARTYLDGAQAYLERVPEVDGNRREAWAVPYLLAVGTLRELHTRPEDALTPDGVKITRGEVEAVVGAALAGGDIDLAGLRERVAAGRLEP